MNSVRFISVQGVACVRRSIVRAALLALGSAGGAHAAEPALLPFSPEPASGWIITLGGSAQIGPKFDGSSKWGLSGMPSLSWRRAGEDAGFSAPDDGLDYALYETPTFSFGPVASFRDGRYSGSSRRLTGLRDLPWTIEAGAFVEFWPIQDRLRTRLEIRQGFHGHHGIVADLSADWVEKFGNFTWSGGPRLSLGDGAFMRRSFGVSASEAAANGWLTPFKARSGVRAAGLGTALEYRWSQVWTTTVFAKYEHLMGDASQSPIVRTLGSRDQLSFGVGATYSFHLGG